MICAKCGAPMEAGDEMQYRGDAICEDCYVNALSVPRTCDVAAVRSATQARKEAGHTGTEGLTDQQKELYNFIIDQGGKVPFAALMEKFSLPETEFMKIFVPLRHCELLKASMINGVKHCVIMEDTAADAKA